MNSLVCMHTYLGKQSLVHIPMNLQDNHGINFNNITCFVPLRYEFTSCPVVATTFFLGREEDKGGRFFCCCCC